MSVGFEVFIISVVMLLLVILAVQIQMAGLNAELGEIKSRLDKLLAQRRD